MPLDGRLQRKAFTAAEQALRALGRGNGDRAAAAAARAAELDQIGVYASLVDLVERGAGDLDGGSVSTGTWEAIRDALPGPLASFAEEHIGD